MTVFDRPQGATGRGGNSGGGAGNFATTTLSRWAIGMLLSRMRRMIFSLFAAWSRSKFRRRRAAPPKGCPG
jgi:hypothetical protein